MTNFKALKKQIDKLLKKAEDEALEQGVDITSAKFQSVFRELKRKILAEKGISLEEYEKLEEETYSVGKIGDAFKDIAGVIEEQTKKEKEKSQQNIKELQEEFSDKIDTLKEEQDNKIRTLIEKTDAERKELLNEIRILVDKLKKQEDASDKQIKALRELNDKIVRIDLRKDTEIYNLQESIKNLIQTEEKTKKQVDKIKIPKQLTQKDIDSAVNKSVSVFKDKLSGKINKEVQEAIIEPVRRLGMGLRKRADSKISKMTPETPSGTINGTNKVLYFLMVYIKPQVG